MRSVQQGNKFVHISLYANMYIYVLRMCVSVCFAGFPLTKVGKYACYFTDIDV